MTLPRNRTLRCHRGRRGPDADCPQHRSTALRRQLRSLPQPRWQGRHQLPRLTDDDWLWGGGPELIEQTMRVGINTAPAPTPGSRQMPAFGHDEMLDRDQVHNVMTYVYSLTNPDHSTPENLGIDAGKEVFATYLCSLPRRECCGQSGRWSAKP